MTIKDVVNEGFDVSKFRQTRDIQKNIEKISQFVRENPEATKSIAGDVSNLNTSFASLLASAAATLQQELEEQKRKENEEKKKKATLSSSRAGIGTTIPITKPDDSKETTKS